MFYVLLEGEGGRSSGCDYTIGCNLNYEQLDAVTWDDAKKEVAHMLEESSRIEGAVILEVAKREAFDVDKWKSDQKAASQKEAETADEAARRKQYEKLKEEFEGDKKTPHRKTKTTDIREGYKWGPIG
jgi:hypothetical protein